MPSVPFLGQSTDLEGIHASPKAYVLKDIKELLKHLALTSKNPEEIAVVTKVWEEFKK